MRTRTLITALLAVLTTLVWAPAAQAAEPVCGYWLQTGNGRTIHCMYQYNGKAYLYEYTTSWRQLSGALEYTSLARQQFRASTSDGLTGWFNGSFIVKTIYGYATWGEHCVQYGTTWWCRFGVYNHSISKFLPDDTGWHKLVS